MHQAAFNPQEITGSSEWGEKQAIVLPPCQNQRVPVLTVNNRIKVANHVNSSALIITLAGPTMGFKLIRKYLYWGMYLQNNTDQNNLTVMWKHKQCIPSIYWGIPWPFILGLRVKSNVFKLQIIRSSYFWCQLSELCVQRSGYSQHCAVLHWDLILSVNIYIEECIVEWIYEKGKNISNIKCKHNNGSPSLHGPGNSPRWENF